MPTFYSTEMTLQQIRIYNVTQVLHNLAETTERNTRPSQKMPHFRNRMEVEFHPAFKLSSNFIASNSDQFQQYENSTIRQKRFSPTCTSTTACTCNTTRSCPKKSHFRPHDRIVQLIATLSRVQTLKTSF